MATNVDALMESLGNPGKAQCILAFLINLNTLLVSIHQFSMVFMGVTPKHHCKVSDKFPLNSTVPFELIDGQWEPSQCHMFIDPTNHSRGTTECTNGWTYLFERGEWSVVGQFNLVCKRQYLMSLTSTIYFVGTIVGATVFGHLADRVGRKRVYLTTLYAHILVGVAQYFSDSYEMFVAFKFLHGILIQGIQSTALCLTMELFATAWRTEASMFCNWMGSIGEFVLVFLAYFNPNWRYLNLASTLPSLITIVYIWIVPESLRWLLVNRRGTQALKVCKQLATFNKINNDPQMEEKISHVIEDHSKANTDKEEHDIRDLFRAQAVRRTTFIVAYLWFAMGFVYFGITFSLPDLHGDKYNNFAISVAIEFVCQWLTYPALKKLGRRITALICFVLTGSTCIASALISCYLQGNTAESVATGLAIFGRAAATSTFIGVVLQTQEAFPTVLRSSALGLGEVFNHVGSMIAPQVILLGVYTYPIVPFLLVGFVAIASALISLLMPETFRSPLPDSMEQAEMVNTKDKKKPEVLHGFFVSIIDALRVQENSAIESQYLEYSESRKILRETRRLKRETKKKMRETRKQMRQTIANCATSRPSISDQGARYKSWR